MKDGKRDLFLRMIRLLNNNQGRDLPEAEMSRVKGEVALLLSLTAFNDIAKMSAYHKEALVHLNDGSESSSSVILGKVPWTFGVTSVLCLFWNGIGQLDETVALMDECLPTYSRITSGHGAGADSVFRAETHLMRGEDAEAEAACYKAIYQARGERQMGICLCAELVLARIAILRGDGNTYATIRAGITKNSEEPRQRDVSRMGELCLALLDMTLGNARDLPKWLRDADDIRRLFYAQGHSYVFMLYGMMLLLEGRRAELYGLADPLLNMARGMNYLLPQVYQHIYLAVAKKSEGVLSQAAECLRAALKIALPDKVYLPFAEFGAALLPLLEPMKKMKNGGENFDTEEISDVIALCERWSSGVASITRHNAKGKTLLTAGERKIALKAKERLSVREIASRLNISENTVKSALKAIYDKLGIHSKADLAEKDF